MIGSLCGGGGGRWMAENRSIDCNWGTTMDNRSIQPAAGARICEASHGMFLFVVERAKNER